MGTRTNAERKTRLRTPVARRPSLPLTERDVSDLTLMRQGPSAMRDALQDVSGLSFDEGEPGEAVVLHAIFSVGLEAVRVRAQEAGYAALAEQYAHDPIAQAERHEQRTEERRRRPSWADEP